MHANRCVSIERQPSIAFNGSNEKERNQIMKFPRLIPLLLAGALLVSCTPNTPANTTTVGSTTTGTTAPNAPEKTPIGAITPGEAKDHLVKEGADYTLYSPDGTLGITVNTEGQMSYSVFRVRDGETTRWVRPSKLGITVSGKSFYKNVEVTEATATEVKVSYPLYGNQRTAEGHCMEAVLNLTHGDYSYSLEVRAYNDGVAFRYCLPELASVTRLEELTTYALRTDLAECWYGVSNQDYEAEIKSFSPTRASNDVITAPLTAVVKNNRGYISIMEGALNETSPGVNLKAEGKSTYSTCFYTTPTVPSGAPISGWRLINIADDLNGLVNNYNIYTVNEAPDEALYADISWIETGRSAWSWCTTLRVQHHRRRLARLARLQGTAHRSGHFGRDDERQAAALGCHHRWYRRCQQDPLQAFG